MATRTRPLLPSVCPLICLTLLLPTLLAVPEAAGSEALSGHWEGEIPTPGTALGIRVDLEETDGSWSGTIDIPLQNAEDLALTGITAGGGKIGFRIDGVPGEPAFDGRLEEGT